MRNLRIVLHKFKGDGSKIPGDMLDFFLKKGWEIISTREEEISPYSLNQYNNSFWTLPFHLSMSDLKKHDKNMENDIIHIGITSLPIYMPGLSRILADSFPHNHTILISTADINSEKNSNGLIKSRIKKLIIHEVGHIFGLLHCPDPTCVMSKSESINHLDEKTDEFCEKCYEIFSRSQLVPVTKYKNATDAKFIYSPGYYADIGQHVFPVIKYRVLYERLIDEGMASPENVLTPKPASWEDLSIFLEPEYIDDMKSLNWSKRTLYSELPLNEEITGSFRLAADGTYLAGVTALDCGFALNLTGGFHHAYRDHAEGFCYINDVAYTILKLKKEGLIENAAVLDCDLHQGNGTAFIFRDDPDVFTFSIHQENNYPPKEKSDLDIGLEDGVGDDIYLAKLRQNIPAILEFHKPDIVLYLAGGDPYRNDQLGGLNLTMNGLLQRDQLVIGQCRRRGIPVAVVLAGGYAYKFEDTIRIHLNTAEAGLGGFG